LTDTAGDVSVLCVVGNVVGVTQLHDVVYIVYIVCDEVSISRFNTTTYQRLTDIVVKGLECPTDIVACERTSQLYVADTLECIWRVSSDGEDIKRWLPKSPSDTFEPDKLSVTSTRLLVTILTRQLRQFDALGDELRRVQLPRYIDPMHAVESPTGTFIISRLNRPLRPKGQVCEINTVGEVLRLFSSSRLSPLITAPHVAVDSHGNILVLDTFGHRILLLDAHLTLRRVIVGEHQLDDKQPDKRPYRLCYMEQSGQLLVGLVGREVAVFDVLRR